MVAKYLKILAGTRALESIRSQGLQPEHVSSVFGASGAAKWLGIYGLDHAIFSRWLTRKQSPTRLFGTSVGAWKLAAAAQTNPGEALTRFAESYIEQFYGEHLDHPSVIRETGIIIDKFLGPGAVASILDNPHYFFHCSAIKSKGLMASENKWRLLAAMGLAVIKNRGERKRLASLMERVVFSDPRDTITLARKDSVDSRQIGLNRENFIPALRASGSIPYLMPAVESIPGAPAGFYRDGGLLDYHPVSELIWQDDGLVLYPHFYDILSPGWFDKNRSGRNANGQQLENVVLLCPTDAYLNKLPQQRLPDRNDFKAYFKRDTERQAIWRQAMETSLLLGEEFLDLVESDDLASVVKAIP